MQNKAGDEEHQYTKECYEQELVERPDNGSEESTETSPESLYP